ncbi:MAG TPA: hypothetical protein VNR86_03130 [Sphingomicrobium sp.]|nr:hypothetical protein [Sphingomicrobium sp.]
MDRKLPALDRLPQVVLEKLALCRFAMHRWLIEAMLAAPCRLCGIKGKIGVADECVSARPAGIADDDPHRCPDRHLVALDHVGAGDLLDQRPCKRFEEPELDCAWKHGLELVASKTPDLPVIALHRFQALGDLAKKSVADRMAKRIIDVLEAVEVDHEERAALLPVSGVAKRFVKRLAHHCAVRKAGQRIEACKA